MFGEDGTLLFYDASLIGNLLHMLRKSLAASNHNRVKNLNS